MPWRGAPGAAVVRAQPVWLACTLAAALVLGPRATRAQAPADLLAEGVRAYGNLEFERAAGLLRRDLARPAASAAPAADRATALAYLGAADFFRGRRDSATAVFRRLVTFDPRYRPDPLVFPPEVTSLFDAVRQETKTVLVVVPRDTAIATGTGSWGVRLVASSFQRVDVTLHYDDGALFRSLYFGPIGDSLTVRWDGLDQSGATPRVTRLLLRVASRAPTGELAGIVQVPLELRAVPADTVPWPAAPLASRLLPERAGSGLGMRALAGGALLAAAVVVLPTAVGSAGQSSTPRVAVAGTLGLAGVLGFILHRPGQRLDANIRANQAVREVWDKGVATAKAENAQRRRDIHVAIRADTPTAIGPRGP